MVVLQHVHGSENDFFLLDQTTLIKPLSAVMLSALTKKLTDPQMGVGHGADGLLAITAAPGTAGQMTVVNTDGSFAKLCGNGLRTVARYLDEQKRLDQFLIRTEFADLAVAKQPELAPHVPAYSVEISPVSFAAKDLPFAHLGDAPIIDRRLPEIDPELMFTAVAVPNPHLIAFVSQEVLNGPKLGEIGRRLNAPNPYFPEGVNVTFATVLTADTLFARTYERGVGFTNACGTGMSATSLAYVLTAPQAAHLGETLTVYNPGGMVKTIVHQDARRYWIELIGNATVTETITVSEDDLLAGNFANAEVTATGEAEAYADFVAQLPYRDFLTAEAD